MPRASEIILPELDGTQAAHAKTTRNTPIFELTCLNFFRVVFAHFCVRSLRSIQQSLTRVLATYKLGVA
jgi:hypothetical protein